MACRYPSQGNIMRYGAFGRCCEYLGQIAYPPNFVDRPTGPFGGFLASFVTRTPDLDFRLALQAPDFTEKYGSPQSNAWRSIGRTSTNETIHVLDLKLLQNPSNGRALANERARITATNVSQSQQHIKTSDWW